MPLGPAGAPVAAEVLGHPVRSTSTEEMQYFILLALTDRYAVDHGIVVTQGEVDAHPCFLEDQAAQGRFRILNPDYAAAFWHTGTDDTRWRFLDAGSDSAVRAFDTPAPPCGSTLDTDTGCSAWGTSWRR